MTGTGNGTRSTVANMGRVIFVLSVVIGVVLAAVAGWGLVEARDRDSGLGPDEPLVGNEIVVPMTEGGARTVYVDGQSLPEAECTVTAPDGRLQTLEGFDPVGGPRLGRRALGEVSAEQAGDFRVQCTGVQEAWVSEETDPRRGGFLTVATVAGLFLIAGVVPTAGISLVVWRLATRRTPR